MIRRRTREWIGRRTLSQNQQNTARTARIIDNMAICRTFVQSVFTVIITRVGGLYRPHLTDSDRGSNERDRRFLRVLLGFNVSAVGAGGMFAT